MSLKTLVKLNLGCGANKIKGCVNIDIEKGVKPDLALDFVNKPLPYRANTVDEVYLFHTIEHIRKVYHPQILHNIYRVLKTKGRVIISYPNFRECATRWIMNEGGQKQFWENTIFGRQLFPSDHHVCAMDPVELQEKMLEIGFYEVRSKPEKDEPYNTITSARKGLLCSTLYEDLVKDDINKMVVKGVRKK